MFDLLMLEFPFFKCIALKFLLTMCNIRMTIRWPWNMSYIAQFWLYVYYMYMITEII